LAPVNGKLKWLCFRIGGKRSAWFPWWFLWQLVLN